MSLKWESLISQRPRELVIGSEHSKQIEEENGLNELLFRISSLNFLEVNKTPLKTLQSGIDFLVHLTNLVLIGNQLEELPVSIGNLRRLKVLNVSDNRLVTLPDELGKLKELQSLIASGNSLSDLPNGLANLSNLTVVKLNSNKFKNFPIALCNENLKTHLSEIHATHNEISDIPPAINLLSALKLLDLSDNQVVIVPGELSDCSKLKDLNLKSNPLKDRRLLKLVEQARQKQIMDYIKANCLREKPAEKPNEEKPCNKEKKIIDDEEESFAIKVIAVEELRRIVATPIALQMRKVVCCIVRNVTFSDSQSLKKFLQLQTSLHENVCNKRQAATLATHDLAKVHDTITFDLKPPTKIKLWPLNRNKEMTAQELYKVLNEEADAYRKEKKRTSYSGIHKYLFLLKGKQRYPCLVDSNDVVISFPPLTNSHVTRVTEDTKDLLIEVTGETVNKCKEVMEALFLGMFKIGLGRSVSDQNEDIEASSLLEIEAMKVVDPEGSLQVFYPSRVDLKLDNVAIIRSDHKTAQN